MFLERLWYETSPYAYAAIGVGAILEAAPASLLSISAMLLLAASLTAIGLRLVHRLAAWRASARGLERQCCFALIAQSLATAGECDRGATRSRNAR